MDTLTTETLASGVVYDTPFPQWESQDELAKDPESMAIAFTQVNNKLKQDAIQGAKGPVRDEINKVAKELGYADLISALSPQERLPDDVQAEILADERVSEAIAHAVEVARDFRHGQGRGPSGTPPISKGTDALRRAKKTLPPEEYTALVNRLLEEAGVED